MKIIVLMCLMMGINSVWAEEMIICSNQKGDKVEITIKPTCLTVQVSENHCPRCSPIAIIHTFTTCKEYQQFEDLDYQAPSLRSGKWKNYQASSTYCLRPGCINSQANIKMIDATYTGSWKIVELSTNKIGTDYYEINQSYKLPNDLKNMKCVVD